MTIQAAFAHILDTIRPMYEPREAANIAHLVMEHITGLGKLDRVIHKDGDLTPTQEAQHQQAVTDLLNHRPVQHITGKSWFYGMELLVSGQVLIPRPETEELVEWILLDHPDQPPLRLLDVGTGSGCIPIALKKQWSSAEILAMDVSSGALALASKNAITQHTTIKFIEQDVLAANAGASLPSLHIIVSNPPYIRDVEKADMQRQVYDYEPDIALFVPDNDALRFYRRIAQLGIEKLEAGGKLYFEINEALGKEVIALLETSGYKDVQLKQDMFGKDRMVRGTKA